MSYKVKERPRSAWRPGWFRDKNGGLDWYFTYKAAAGHQFWLYVDFNLKFCREIFVMRPNARRKEHSSGAISNDIWRTIVPFRQETPFIAKHFS